VGRDLFIGTLLYTCSTLILFGLFHLSGWSLENPIFWLFLLGLSLSFGYIISNYILSHKRQVDDHLLHLTKEILHELNIPLATIQANSSLLKRTLREDTKGLKRLHRIDDALLRLERLYKELVYSIKKEIHPIEKERFALDVLLSEHVDGFRLMQRNPFVLDLSPLFIRVDKIGFEKTLDNIIMNAMKYSAKSSPIKILLTKEELIIADQGVGIDETELVRIFERYYQLDRQHQGEGIGLALVKSYCDREGIGIRIDSQKGVGTKVILNLRSVIDT